MIPRAGEDLLNLHLDQARSSERDDFAELQLQKAEAILAYALVCRQIQTTEHSNRVALIGVIRAQRQRIKAAGN